jgi:hypothetical protein
MTGVVDGNDAGPAQETVAAINKAGGKAIASTLSITEPKKAEAIVKSALDVPALLTRMSTRPKASCATSFSTR